MKVGIDLGTTNSALAFIDPVEAADADFPPIHALSVPQLVGQDRTEGRPTLPSFLFLADPPYAGVYAREQGALVPTKSVHSAKSWLSNAEVDRTAKILPWEANEGAREMSPVEASAHYLRHLAQAWERAQGTPLAAQEIVLTVPASFDEEARELTVQAARDAGLDNLTLIEEPAAAFYAWIAHHLAQSQKSLVDGMTVLVCDVGGGTSDFTLIRVNRTGDRVEFTRTDVGKHLLLGGDNLDLTLAWLAESKIGKPLSLRQRSALRRQCAAAKERLLSDANLPAVEITVLGAGTGLVGGTLKTEITRAEALELTLEGFLPFCALSDKPKEDKRSVFRELGLPYVADPAVTRHLAAFLETAGGAVPDAILFNGGFFIPEICRARVADVLEQWFGKRPLLLENQNLDLAVAVGAAYYSYVRSTGSGLIVRGGLPRAYFIEIGAPGATDDLQTVCLVPRGTEDGASLELDRADLQLVANKPVSFHLFSSLARVDDQLGDVVAFSRDDHELHRHAPLQAVIRFGKRTEERLVPVKLGARLTEVGTLEIYADSRVSEHRWRLQFELRRAATNSPTISKAAAVVSDENLQKAKTLIADLFAGRSSVAPEELPAKLEAALALGRNSWPLSAIRAMADVFLENADGRKRGPAFEARWLNLCGWCLRPGFGYPGDDLRIEQVRRLLMAGLVFPNQVQCEIDRWIFVGRVAGGFNRNQQVDVFQRIAANVLPKGGKAPRLNSSLLREMWRTAASLERLPMQTRQDLGEALVKKVKANEAGTSDYWCLSRIGARELFYGPANQVIPPAVAARWAETLVKAPASTEALVAIARRTGDAARDLPAASFELVRRALASRPEGEQLVASLESGGARDLGRVFGEALPTGLVFAPGGEL